MIGNLIWWMGVLALVLALISSCSVLRAALVHDALLNQGSYWSIIAGITGIGLLLLGVGGWLLARAATTPGPLGPL